MGGVNHQNWYVMLNHRLNHRLNHQNTAVNHQKEISYL
jgi:hypothetical protein